jgi:hypothetical protein
MTQRRIADPLYIYADPMKGAAHMPQALVPILGAAFATFGPGGGAILLGAKPSLAVAAGVFSCSRGGRSCPKRTRAQASLASLSSAAIRSRPSVRHWITRLSTARRALRARGCLTAQQAAITSFCTA